MEHRNKKQRTWFDSSFKIPPQPNQSCNQDGAGNVDNWAFRRCHIPGCCYSSSSSNSGEIHIGREHKEMSEDRQKLGWFWGTMQTMNTNNPRTIIAEGFGQGTIWECQKQHCRRIFVAPMAVRNQFSRRCTRQTLENWEPRMRCLD
jgi:hypothetical protein